MKRLTELKSCFICLILVTESTTATVGRVVVPRANHISPENLVTPAAGKGQPVHHTTYTVVAGHDRVSSSSGSSSSTDEDMEQYEQEPGIRRPSRSFSGDLDVDLEEYNEEPVPRKRQQGNDEQPSGKADSKFSDKKAAGQKGPRLKIPSESRSRTFAEQVQNSPGLSEDVWKEAMAGVPLASSESFDLHLLSREKDQSAGLDDMDDDDDDVYERRGRRKGKQDRSRNRVNDLQWTADLPVDDSLSRETLDDISCDSYVPPHPAAGWDLDSPEVDVDDYTEEGSVKVLDMMAPSWDEAQGRVMGRRQEREDRQRQKTLSASFETNIDDIEFDTEPQQNVPNVNQAKQPEGAASGQEHEPPKGETAANQNVPNINKTKRAQIDKEKRCQNGPVSNVNVAKELAVAAAKEKKRRSKRSTEDEAGEEVSKKGKTKKARQPVGSGSSATIPIMAADEVALSFEEDEDSYRDEPMKDLSADINVRLWQGPSTDIDDDDLLIEPDEMLANLHDQRLDEESTDISLDEKQIPPVKRAVTRMPQRDLQPVSDTSGPSSSKPEIIDRLPDRPRRSQPIAGARDSQSSRQRQPLPRDIAAHRPYNGISVFYVRFVLA